MARIRKFSAYRKVERPYTRVSKFRNKSFIRASPNLKIVRFEMGDPRKEFSHTVELISKTNLQIRHDAIESARQSANRVLEKELGKTGYFMKIMIYPFHILRENPLASGAGADRMSTGMKMSFGKAIGAAAQLKKGQKVCITRVNKNGIEVAKKALGKASKKLPNSYALVVKENKPVSR
ncbi:MAG: 50S ribosomal protein L16 [Candidatus Nanoarchaeia archaeon]|nr:50S ribosomal protein L16 [Candidatus Nanoarchaeia archaeon]